MKDISSIIASVCDLATLKTIALMVLTALTTHLFESQNQRKQQLINYENTLKDLIMPAYFSVIKAERKLTEKQDYTVLKKYKQQINGKSTDVFQYPIILSDWNSFTEYLQQITNARYNFDLYLSAESSAYLHVLEVYLQEIRFFLEGRNRTDLTEVVALIAANDLDQIQIRFDYQLINDINSPRYKLDKNHKKEESLFVKYKEELLDNSNFMKQIHDKDEIVSALEHINYQPFVLEEITDETSNDQD